jgi:hypothetical protein
MQGLKEQIDVRSYIALFKVQHHGSFDIDCGLWLELRGLNGLVTYKGFMTAIAVLSSSNLHQAEKHPQVSHQIKIFFFSGRIHYVTDSHQAS